MGANSRAEGSHSHAEGVAAPLSRGGVKIFVLFFECCDVSAPLTNIPGAQAEECWD
eukprot:CAMPEP_0171104546 /NCGR_PEP_ID=MMETSP0766_2-20121228/60863_1 /TAXON_ID=439317 /ORGANISM="Gambierdiscus australes, Strain CAWD 149" /LENGTH=55 /DNA_ID=CAMNT_0011565193 /DNA_START=50 /DNA_END=220 /DNA_ORIENTATION=+